MNDELLAGTGPTGRTSTEERVRLVFRVVAFAEAVSWAGLLVGMLFKYVVSDNEIGVQVFGPIHGTIFIGYVIASLVAARTFRWSPRLTVVALAASIPPFCTVLFEIWADRHQRLSPAGTGRVLSPPG